MPNLRRAAFESQVFGRHKRRESSVEEALVEMYLAGVSVRRVEDISEALWGTRVSPSTASELNEKIYARRLDHPDSDPPMSDRPLVSCICVTRNRVPLLRRAVSCFLHQTYQPRELVILYETDDADTRAYLDTLSCPSIRLAEVPALPNIQLGSLRNLAIAASHGHYVAQWDDDDWYGPNRLAEQINAIQVSGKSACALSRWIIYDTVRQAAFLSGRRPWEGSLVAVRSALPPYPNLPQGEDTPVISQLIRQNKLIPLESPQLYVYVYHGDNTWQRSHWESLFKEAQPVTPDMTELVKSLLGLH